MKKIISTSVLSVLAASLFIAGAASADEGKGGPRGHHGGHFFKMIDADGDGVISRIEHDVHAEERFDLSDTNSDNKITKEEALARFEEMRKEHEARRAERAKEKGKETRERRHAPPSGEFFVEKLFERLDDNGDGVISWEESSAHSNAMFERLDANGDEKITQEEAREAHQKHREKRAEKRERKN